tara:strand:- start:124 stop:426 length:303 start_codon:yes stop_codon:yes gene_type:complete
MKIVTGQTDVAVSGTAAQISTSGATVVRIMFLALEANSGIVYVGMSTVTTSNGFPVVVGMVPELATTKWIDCSPGGVKLSDWYADAATSGDDVAWIAVTE